jgi:hypothetical protein
MGTRAPLPSQTVTSGALNQRSRRRTEKGKGKGGHMFDDELQVRVLEGL